jgi:hypothetical protein
MVSAIARQLHVSSSELRAMVACSIGADAYVDIVKKFAKANAKARKPPKTRSSKPHKSTGGRKHGKRRR